MRYFDIYLMEEELTQLYLGKEDLLFRFFMEAKSEIDLERRNIFDRQIAFITQPIAYTMLRRFLKNQHIIETSNGHWMITQNNGCASLTFAKSYLTLKASGTVSPETIFFELLRQAFPNFFAIDYQNERGAWLNPHKKHILYQRQLVL
jgi:hypothetical protein